MVNIITALLKKEGIKISYLGTNYLVNSCRNDYDIIMSEIDKIKIYIGESHEISDDELKKVVCDSSEVSNFNFSDSVVKKDYNKALKILDVLKDNKVEIHMLIGLLSSQYRLIYTVKELSQKGLSESEILKKVGGHPYSLKLAINNSFNYSYKELREWLKDLANLDYKIKSGTFTGYMPLEMLLLER